MRQGRKLLLSAAFGLLSGVTQAQTPSPAQLGLVIATPNVVQVLDSSNNWATIGTINATTHVFTVSGAGGIPEAPTGSGVLYGRKNSAWSTVAHTDITDWTATLTPYALLASPAFTGTPSLPTGATGITQSPGDSSTKLATTAFVGAAVTAGAYTLPTASTTTLGGVKVDGTTINISSGVISGASPAITANTTPTTGFAASQLLMSDGAKTQALSSGKFVNLGNATYPVGMFALTATESFFNHISVNNAYADAYAISLFVPPYTGIEMPGGPNAQYPPGYYGFITTSNGSTITPDVAFTASGSAIAAFRNLTTLTSASALRVYNTYTDASNGEWGALDWQTTANTLTLGAQKNGTGTLRPVSIVGSSVAISGITQPTSGVSGGIPYFSSTTALSSSALLTANALMIGKGAGVAPATTTTGAGIVTALGIAPGTTGSPALQSGAITTGDLVKWSGATGVSDAGVAPLVSGIISNGTQPTITPSGGTCAVTTKVGGATSGTVILSAVCASTNTLVFTGMPTATNGWNCDAQDRTTRTAGPFQESAATTTGFTLTVGATSSVAADVLQWMCIGY